jgi:hypothetical protein
LPLHYAYGFVAAALVGAFTIVGLAGSYTRMLLKTESFNQVRQDRENLRKDYKQMAQIAHDRDVQVASLGALASEVTALYGLKQNKLARQAPAAGSAAASAHPRQPGAERRRQPAAGEALHRPVLCAARRRSQGRVSRALEGGLTPKLSPATGRSWPMRLRSGRSRAAWPRASASGRSLQRGRRVPLRHRH